jgi:hypothetical protein
MVPCCPGGNVAHLPELQRVACALFFPLHTGFVRACTLPQASIGLLWGNMCWPPLAPVTCISVPLQCLQSLRVPTTGMAKNLGSRGGGATLQRSKLDLRQKQQTWEPKLDSGSGGGGIGKGIFNGGAPCFVNFRCFGFCRWNGMLA